MAGDPAADGRGRGGGHGSSAGKGPRSSSRHHLFRDRAKTRVDDLQEMFSGLQSARKESRTADAVLLEEQVHHMLLEWRAELSVASPASSLQNSQSQGNGRAASDPPSETLRLLQLALTEEEDDATSKLLVPQSPLRMPSPHQSQGHGHGHGQGGDNLNPEPQGEAEAVAGGAAESVVTQSPLSVQLFHQSHGHGQDGQGVDLDLQGEAVTGGAGAAQQSLDQGMQGHCGGEVGDVTNSMFHDQMYYIGHELTIDDFLRDDDYKLTLPGSNSDGHNNLQGLGQMEHEQFNLPLDLQPSNPYADVASCVPNSGDVFFHMSDLLTTMCASPSDYLGPKCALWDCGRPVRGTDECQDYCDPYHAGLALNDDGLLGTRPVMRPRGIDLKDGPLFAALSAKIQGKNVGIPVCEGAATTKSPWNVPELFDLSLLEGESLREWLFFDRPRRAFDSGNRKQRSLPDYSGRGWHESRKQVMKDFGGLKRSYYMDPQPSSNYEWHLFEYEINDADTVALYRLEFKSSDGKRSVKSKLAISPLNELQQQMVKLSADSPENKRTARSRPKATQKDNNVNTSSALNTPNQVSASNAYHTSTLNTPNQVSGSNAYQAMSLNTPDQVSVSNAYQTMSLNTPDQASGSNAYQTASQVDQMTCLNENVVYGPQLPYENVVYGPQLPYENVVYGPQLPYGYPNQRSDFHWNPSDGT